MIELRWTVPDGTTAERPRLQYRQCGQWPAAWGEWQDVPTVVVPNEPKPAPTVAHVFGVSVDRHQTFSQDPPTGKDTQP